MSLEPCFTSLCHWPDVCSNYGYCRERNRDDGPPFYTTPELIERRRREALDRIAARRVEKAAPALLKALKHLVHWHDQLSPADIAMAEAAIAQAEAP